MSRDFPPVLARLIPRLGSSFDGEVLATARAIERTLKSQKLDWHDVAAAVTALPLPPRGTRENAPIWRYLDNEKRLQWLAGLATEPGLDPWSRSFVKAAQIKSGCRLSPKQLGCIDKILAAAWRRGVRPDTRQRA
jgi:hypothetical protein